MPDQAHVTSVHAIESFRGDLINFVTKAKPVLEEACDEVLRTREWLEQDRRVFWENQVRRRSRALEDAQQALFSAQLSKLRNVTTAEQMAVAKARRALAEAEEKVRAIKKWTRDFDELVQPLLKKLEQLRSMLARDMPQAAIHLAEVVKSLDAYAQIASEKATELRTTTSAVQPGEL